MVFSFNRRRGGRFDALVEKLGIIRCQGGLANYSGRVMDMW
ncbi:hypothetical protein T3H00_06725 [Pseudomonas fluorescens]|nr:MULTISPECIES: hypothetical protein [Pseudomonas]MDZ5432355.1 hypothetical protein [Pseudomonas fluorescens]